MSNIKFAKSSYGNCWLYDLRKENKHKKLDDGDVLFVLKEKFTLGFSDGYFVLSKHGLGWIPPWFVSDP